MFILCLYYVYIMFIFPGGGVYLPGRQLDCCCAPSCYISSNCLPCYMYISSNCLENTSLLIVLRRKPESSTWGGGWLHSKIKETSISNLKICSGTQKVKLIMCSFPQMWNCSEFLFCTFALFTHHCTSQWWVTNGSSIDIHVRRLISQIETPLSQDDCL